MLLNEITEQVPLVAELAARQLAKGGSVWLDIDVPLVGNEMLKAHHGGRMTAIVVEPTKMGWIRIIKGPVAVSITFEPNGPIVRSKNIVLEASTFDDRYTLKRDMDGGWLLCNAKPSEVTDEVS